MSDPSPLKTNILVFGAQTPNIPDKAASQLRATLLDSPSSAWVKEALVGLSDDWHSVLKAFPAFETVATTLPPPIFVGWLQSGAFPKDTTSLPNYILTPLVVAIHLSQFVDHHQLGPARQGRYNQVLEETRETLGFCSGLLSAVAVACAGTFEELQQHGATALRLAMLIGLAVDVDNAAVKGNADGWVSASVGWTSTESGAQLSKVLKRVPEAYVSVVYDKKRATVTLPKRILTSFLTQLGTGGITATPISLRGRFHHSHYHETVERLVEFCDANPPFQLPQAANLVLRTRSNLDGQYVEHGKLHRFAVEAMLENPANWYQTFDGMLSGLEEAGSSTQIVCFGLDRCVPPTLAKKLGVRLIQAVDLATGSGPGTPSPGGNLDGKIAVIGMATRVAGADDVDKYWKLLCDGVSQHQEVPGDRFGFESAWRARDPKRKWFGNFIQDVDAFDHKFWRKTPRESSSMDPQQRLMLQVALQATQQAGYFGSPTHEKRVGCFIGLGTVDYEENVACHAPTAFAATGNLRAFAAGRISHSFGWTGPAVTLDTACSASAVAVHQACKAILGGECVSALAGGVSIMTSARLFQDLAAASFLSPTGQCKPFDAQGDGYCRGDGVGAVFLKSLSRALEDGDPILGVIASTAVHQNQNSTAITVPNVESLSELFADVTKAARLEPRHVTVVEAHGTGTPVGDPAEYAAIRNALAGGHRDRDDPLSVGSVKGLIGHTEGAAGIISIVKTLLMMREGSIPPQASHSLINPSLKASPADHMEIATSLKPWKSDLRAALINSYGASGSNASMILTQAPNPPPREVVADDAAGNIRYPFWFSGFDDRAICAYARKLRQFLEGTSFQKNRHSLANLSFNNARQTNRWLPGALIFSCSSVEELKARLEAVQEGGKDGKDDRLPFTRPAAPPPVILCFGGQVSTAVGLDRRVYEGSTLLRQHLGEVNETSRLLGCGAIFPGIFQTTPLQDIVELQLCLFALQYASARAWIDCGLRVASLVGHSFGELTALCVSGMLDLRDAVTMIHGRAKQIRDGWGPDGGAMMAVEGDKADVLELLAKSKSRLPGEPPATIACFNGPRSFTLAGTTKSIDNVVSALQDDYDPIAAAGAIKGRKLNVTNAFHSALAEPLLDGLRGLASGLTLREPTIPLERATENPSPPGSLPLTPDFLGAHLRNPVYFGHVVQRLAKRHPSSVWLEAGSASTITSMAHKALEPSATGRVFQPIDITSSKGGGLSSLAEATVALWKAGLTLTYWPHHGSQTADYASILLPPYQFEANKHWLELKTPVKEEGPKPRPVVQAREDPPRLWSFVEFGDGQGRSAASFRINPSSQDFQDALATCRLQGRTPTFPTTKQIEVVVATLASIRPELAGDGDPPQEVSQIHSVVVNKPIVGPVASAIRLELEALDPRDRVIGHGGSPAVFTTGVVKIQANGGDDDVLQSSAEFAKYGRLFKHRRCLDLLDHSQDSDEVLQGRSIYTAYAGAVEYGPHLQSLQKVVGRGDDCAAIVRLRRGTPSSSSCPGPGQFDSALAEALSQVAGIFAHCLSGRPPGQDALVLRGLEQWIMASSPAHLEQGRENESTELRHVYASNHWVTKDVEMLSDVFVFDARTGALTDVILGILYRKATEGGSNTDGGTDPKLLLQQTALAPSRQPRSMQPFIGTGSTAQTPQATAAPAASPTADPNPAVSAPGIASRVLGILTAISGLESSEIHSDTGLADIGIDSLMGMELAREIDDEFECSMDPNDLNEVADVQSLIDCVFGALGQAEIEGDRNDNASSGDSSNLIQTPSDTPNSSTTSEMSELGLTREMVLSSFAEAKANTDTFIADNKLAGYADKVIPAQTQLTVAHIVNALEAFGSTIRTAKPGETVELFQQPPVLPKHRQYIDQLHAILADDAGLVVREEKKEGTTFLRTAMPLPSETPDALHRGLLTDFPEHVHDHNLTHLTGAQLGDLLTGARDGIQLLFASKEGRDNITGMYGRSPINTAWLRQLEDFFRRLLTKLQQQQQQSPSTAPLRVLEMGAGTGGTSAGMIDLFASLGFPVEYTITDISSSLVAAARKRFQAVLAEKNKQGGCAHLSVRYRVCDIEDPRPPPADLAGTQHVVFATNCVHATRSLAASTANIRRLLRGDDDGGGLLVMLEMTSPIPWIDLSFGMLEGWWLFDDGRRHALAHQERWREVLLGAGYDHVDWTQGALPEADLQRLIMAMAGPTSRGKG
ncbi:hypothetical protein PG984_014762 [Apiospora sp. TS-2023a]